MLYAYTASIMLPREYKPLSVGGGTSLIENSHPRTISVRPSTPTSSINLSASEAF